MSEWGFYCDVESGRILDNPYIFKVQPIKRKNKQKKHHLLYYCIIFILFVSFILLTNSNKLCY